MLIDPPVGTPQERATGQVWPGFWIDNTAFCLQYRLPGGGLARHTGADLNLNEPHWNSDAGAPVYAIANGVVISSALVGGPWGWIIVIEHTDDNNQKFYSRSAHVDHRQPVARRGDPVVIGQVIAHVGNADGYYRQGHHLHFDISQTTVLKRNAAHWPGNVSAAVIRQNYTDPRLFIMQNRGEGPGPVVPPPPEALHVQTTGLRIRSQPNTVAAIIGTLQFGVEVEVVGDIPANGYHFTELLKVNNVPYAAPDGGKGYVAREFLA